jgi:hypothetical protein
MFMIEHMITLYCRYARLSRFARCLNRVIAFEALALVLSVKDRALVLSVKDRALVPRAAFMRTGPQQI